MYPKRFLDDFWTCLKQDEKEEIYRIYLSTLDDAELTGEAVALAAFQERETLEKA